MQEFVKKVVMLGDPSVGKTSLVNRYVNNMFDDKYLTTIGAKPSKKVIANGSEKVTVMIWDLAGQRFSVHPTYYAGAKGALLVCDITRKETLDSLYTWRASLYAKVGNVPTVTLLNKTDLLDWQFEPNDAEDMGFEVMPTSAKSSENVETAFGRLVEMMLDGRGS